MQAVVQVMSMDSRIANKDKTILSLQLEELEPVFMGEQIQNEKYQIQNTKYKENKIKLWSVGSVAPGIFTVEMCAKIVAMGFLLHENSYLRYFQPSTNCISFICWWCICFR